MRMLQHTVVQPVVMCLVRNITNLTPWSRVLLKTVGFSVGEFYFMEHFMEPGSSLPFSKKSLSWARWVSSMLPHPIYFKVYCRIFLPHTPGSFTYSFSFRFLHQSPYVPRASPVSSFSILRYYFKTEPWVATFTRKFSMVPGEQTYEIQINWGEMLMNRESVFVYQERTPVYTSRLLLLFLLLLLSL